jgi:hypothetical protein
MKGDKRDCGNYRGTSILSTTDTILSNILLSMLTVYAEVFLGIIGVDFDMANQLKIIFCFHHVLENNGNALRQCISCL